jgi:hypothetical protein
MLEMGTSGSMSGEGKSPAASRSRSSALLDSTPGATPSDVVLSGPSLSRIDQTGTNFVSGWLRYHRVPDVRPGPVYSPLAVAENVKPSCNTDEAGNSTLWPKPNQPDIGSGQLRGSYLFYVPDKMKPNIIRLGMAMTATKAITAQNRMGISVSMWSVVVKKRRRSHNIFSSPPIPLFQLEMWRQVTGGGTDLWRP